MGFIIRLPLGALDLHRDGTEHLAQSQGVNVIGPHDHMGQRIVEQVVNRRLVARLCHGVAPSKSRLKAVGIDKRGLGVTSK
jgi:hypothetical protein